MIKLTISIVNYNTGDFLSQCLKSIKQASDEAKIKVFVVDNASSDGSAEKAQKNFPWVEFIFNKENLGFGKAHNQVLNLVKEGYILLLNPDTRLENGVLKTVLGFMEEHPDVGAASCKILNSSDGSIDWAAHRGFPTPWASFLYFLGNDSLYHLTNKPMDAPHEVDAIQGAFFMTKKDVLDKVGLFDEDYFMYAEDIDLCFRIKETGFKVMYIPNAKVLHFKGVSSGLKKHSQKITTADILTRQRSLNYFYDTMKIFYKKHYEKKYPFFINWLIYFGIDFRKFLAKRQLTV